MTVLHPNRSYAVSPASHPHMHQKTAEEHQAQVRRQAQPRDEEKRTGPGGEDIRVVKDPLAHEEAPAAS
jgi:hypothetical protein